MKRLTPLMRGQDAPARNSTPPGTLGRVAKIFGADPGDEAANVAALVVINAMVFQDRLASNEVAFQPVSAAMQEGRFPRMTLLQVWEHILGIDYYPIFSMRGTLFGSFPRLKLRRCSTSVPRPPPGCWAWALLDATTWTGGDSTG